LAAISIGQREFEQWNLDVSALRCVRNGSKSRHFKRQASQEFWSLRSRPASTAHRFDDRSGREVVEVPCGGGNSGVAELAGDEGDVDAFGAELGSVGVPQSVGVDALVDTRPGGEAFAHDPDVGGGHPMPAERAEDGVATAQAKA